MKDLLSFYTSMAIGFMNEIEIHNDEWKKRIRDEWEKSKNYPRKKKKRVRKELILNWSIANWNPFEV